MNPENIQDIYELSPMQQGLLFHTLAAPNSGVYFEQLSCTLNGNLNTTAFAQAWQQVVDHHPILRTAFYWEGLEQPFQVVYQQLSVPFVELDWREISQQEQQTKLDSFLESDRLQGFDLSQAPLLRIILIRLSENTYYFVRSHHHILLDGWSWSLLWQDFNSIYQGLCQEKTPQLETARPYRDYITWLQQQDLSKAEVFWRQKLKGLSAPTTLAVDKKPPSLPSNQEDDDTQQLIFSQDFTAALQSFARQHQLTLNVLIQGVWSVLLSRYSGETDVMFGITSSGRPPALVGVEAIAGLFLSTLPLRVQVTGDTLVLPWLKQLQTEQIEVRQYEYTSLSQIQRWSDITPGLPLFETILVFNNFPVDAARWQLGESIGSSNYRSFEKTNYPLTLTVEPSSQLKLNITYDTRRFETANIKRFLANMQTWLTDLVANPQQRLQDLQFLSQEEQKQLLVEWNQTQINYADKKCIHELFEAQVEKTPDSVAVVFEDRQLTYRQLNSKANQLAHYLRSHGVKQEVLVGICVERSLEMVIGLLAILKAGGAYVPLDPNYPQERIQFILEQTQASVLLTEGSRIETIGQHKAQVICLDTDWHKITQQSQDNLSPLANSDNLAYIIYTSGSTGKPKGVQIPHSALSNFLYSMREAPGLTSDDILLGVTTYSFDIAALEIFLPIIVGARLVIASREIALDGIELSALLIDSKATVMQATPATWHNIVAAGWQGNDRLKILCGGEALPAYLANQLLVRCNSLWNMYGPTETTIWSAACQIKTDSKIIPISNPIANTQLYILDQYNQLVPVGVAGELCIGGEGLARGYFHRSDLTAEKFIPNPFSKQASRLYKTGDLARYLANGDIEYIGRIDNQVKIRGFRIELGEIEARLRDYAAVGEAVVIVREDIPGDKRLVAYLVAKNELKLQIPQIRSFLESKLPKYMVPNSIVTLEALPLTPNGKVDRKALPAPDLTQVLSSDIIAASTPIENLLVDIWAEVLGIDKVGIDDNFFELGGHSLIATRVISQIRQVFQVELPLRYLFEKPTIAELAKEIEKAKHTDLGLEVPPIKRIERGTELPLSFAQQRLWFLTQLEPNSSSYNIPAAVRLQGELNHNALEQSFNEIVRRHQALRTNFQTREGQAVAVISKDLFLKLPIFDISELPANQQQAEVKQQASQEAQKPFDLVSDRLIRLKLFRLGEQEHIVLLTMHHIVSDAWSIGVLIDELATLYPAFCAGKPSPLSELSIQYTDFAVWQRQWLQGKVLQTQLDYWKQQLGNTHPRLKFPKPPKRSNVESSQGAEQSFTLSKELTEAINLLNRQEGVTLFMTLLTVFQVLLYCFSGTQDIRVGSPIANRNRVEIEKLIGFFINTLVLRIDLSGNPNFRELLVRSRQVTLEAYAHQDLPFEKLVEELQPERNLNQNPLYQAWFVLQNAPMPELKLPGLTLTPFEIETRSVRHDLLLGIWESSQGLNGVFEYKTNLFDNASISRLIEHFKKVIHHVVAQPDTTLHEIATILTQSDEEQQKIQQQELQTVERQKLKMTKRKIIRN